MCDRALVAVDFDASCTAHVIKGKAAGATSGVRRSIVNHQWIEISSISTGPADCTVKDGNGFAG
jgi:hypothetical protein